MSDNGNRLVMGDINSSNVGKVVVYDYSNGTWTPTDIPHPYGTSESDKYGFDLDISGDGNRIVTEKIAVSTASLSRLGVKKIAVSRASQYRVGVKENAVSRASQ